MADINGDGFNSVIKAGLHQGRKPSPINGWPPLFTKNNTSLYLRGVMEISISLF
jgi:hypothetical protein